jgi:hypothetical protein
MKARAQSIFAMLGGCIIAMALPRVLAQSNAASLRANPFDRPDFVMNLGRVTSPEITAFEPPVELALRATMVSGDGALANINGELLSVGQRIEGYRVARITEGRVLLRNGSEELVLDVYKRQRASEEEARRD